MSDTAYEWGAEHFCAPDATKLYHTEPARLTAVGYPVELDTLPETFCSVCLQWFTGFHDEGSDHRPPPEKGTADD